MLIIQSVNTYLVITFSSDILKFTAYNCTFIGFLCCCGFTFTFLCDFSPNVRNTCFLDIFFLV
uniref:Uncharacterized protein n=1 Tax=Daphnia magna TaxID=35525 RepID=A0A0P6K0D3_9CRUS